MDRFFVPTGAFQSRRAERRSSRPNGHRVFAARSVLDGREHGGILGAEGQHQSLPSQVVCQIECHGPTQTHGWLGVPRAAAFDPERTFAATFGCY